MAFGWTYIIVVNWQVLLWLFYEMGTQEKVGNSTKFSFKCNKAAYFGISFQLLFKADCKLLKKHPNSMIYVLSLGQNMTMVTRRMNRMIKVS